MQQVHTMREIAEQAKRRGRPVTAGYLRRLCRTRAIPGAYKIGPAWVVPAVQVEKWLQEWTRAE